MLHIMLYFLLLYFKKNIILFYYREIKLFKNKFDIIYKIKIKII